MILTHFRVRDSRQCNRKYVDALWQWRRVKTSTDSVGQSLQKEFLIDDTGLIFMKYLSGGAIEQSENQKSYNDCIHISKTGSIGTFGSTW